MSWNVWNRPSWSFMVDIGISSNIVKSPSPKCDITLWDMTIYNDTFNWSDITTICELITELHFITDFDLITKFRRFPKNIATDAASQQRTLTPSDIILSHFGLAFVLMLRPFFPELVMSTDLLSFEHSSVITILLWIFKQIPYLRISK